MKLGVDIDGTLFYSEWNDILKEYVITGVNKDLIKAVNDVYDKGQTVIVNTARHWDQLQYTIDQLKHHGVKYTTLVMGKPSVDLFIDDRAVKPEDFLNEL